MQPQFQNALLTFYSSSTVLDLLETST
ncbi:hypothetical protein ANCCAN_25724 [Ancylostoma caninum]|uniref:Uncharacterized protein n=1 Tax=Ancylostoma caninum TaxID=29170 RepID=A0A368F8Y9_ANCCA|nr:hypothetical protein ANCCAN_25724 [Ancylostoma caninum]